MPWRSGRALLSALVLMASLGGLAYACVYSEATSNRPREHASASSGSAGGAFDRNALLQSLADDVIVPTYADFVAAAAALEAATASYASSSSGADREAARQAWRDAMDVWERAELTLLGPAGVSGVASGGQDLRDAIYSWPLVNRCATDQVVVSGDYADVSAFGNRLVNVRGLDAMEYLLFNESTANTCAPQVPINANGDWDALTDLEQRRADYASSLAQLVHQHAVTLHDAWNSGFANELGGAGESSATYASAQDALNALSDAMFYLEAVTKDLKLAVPTGLSPDCTNDVCPEDLELRFSGYSKEAIRQNILGFERLFAGGTSAGALGFDDWLVSLGAGDIVTRMADKIAAAKAAVDAIEEGDLTTALAQDPQSVVDVYFALKDITDILRSEFVSTLDLDLPQAVQGDDD